jgi:hypothetical protein
MTAPSDEGMTRVIKQSLEDAPHHGRGLADVRGVPRRHLFGHLAQLAEHPVVERAVLLAPLAAALAVALLGARHRREPYADGAA